MMYLRNADFMMAAGVPEEAARAAVAERVDAFRLRGQVANFDHTPSVARLLGMPCRSFTGGEAILPAVRSSRTAH